MKKITFDKQFFIMLLLFIPYIKLPEYIVGSRINNIFDLWKICSFLILLALIIKKSKMSTISILFLLFELVMLYATTRTTDYSKMWTQLVQTLSVVGIILYSDYYLNKDSEKFFSVVSKYICLLSFINSVTMFIYYPYGMYTDARFDSNYYFLQLDNIAFFTVYIGLITLILHSKLKYNKVDWKVYLFIVFTFSSYFYTDSTTSYFAILLLLIGTFLVEKFNFKLNYNICILLIALFSFGITVFHIQDNFEFFIVNILHKRLDFTSRRWIWNRTIKYIIANPIIGYGLESGRIMEMKIGFNHIHNIFLEIFYKGGIISFIIYGLILFFMGKKMSEIKGTKYYSLLCLFITLFLFICQFDYYNDIYVTFIIYVLLFRAPTYVKDNRKVNNNESINNIASIQFRKNN